MRADRLWFCLLDVEAGHQDLLRTAVDGVVREVLSHRPSGPGDQEESHAHRPLVHCGRTKAFLTQYLVRLV